MLCAASITEAAQMSPQRLSDGLYGQMVSEFGVMMSMDEREKKSPTTTNTQTVVIQVRTVPSVVTKSN
jgi:hypothetical protein